MGLINLKNVSVFFNKQPNWLSMLKKHNKSHYDKLLSYDTNPIKSINLYISDMEFLRDRVIDIYEQFETKDDVLYFFNNYMRNNKDKLVFRSSHLNNIVDQFENHVFGYNFHDKIFLSKKTYERWYKFLELTKDPNCLNEYSSSIVNKQLEVQKIYFSYPTDKDYFGQHLGNIQPNVMKSNKTREKYINDVVFNSNIINATTFEKKQLLKNNIKEYHEQSQP